MPITTELQPAAAVLLTALAVPSPGVGLTTLGTVQTVLVPGTAPSIVTLINTGIQGPPGNGTGGGSGYYNHPQPVAAATWIINHNFGYRPNVSVYSVGGLERWAEVLHTSDNQAQVFFDSAAAGYAVCS